MSAGKSGLKAPSKPSKAAIVPSTGSGASAPSASTKTKTASTPSGTGAASESASKLDDFIIGDRVYVGGTKPGHIQYIGETQFAPGDWAGVVLDEPVGKNDGAVHGVRYFQCEPMKGVFARLSKLKREPTDLECVSPTSSVSTPGVRQTQNKNGLMRKSLSQNDRMSQSSPYGSVSSLTGDTGHDHGKARLGDRVIVSGTKKGTLRYLGTTEFARGDWAGIELDEALGKNDGSVAGKRYFTCKPLYGLFAPAHKISKLSGGDASTPIRASMMENRLALGLQRENSGSQDSISSIGSSASSISRSRVRLGVTSLNSPKKSAQPSKLTPSTSIPALQKALVEKEDHIEQLLRERDMERSEVARAAAQVDEAEGKLISLKSEYEKSTADNDGNVTKLKDLIQFLEAEKSILNTQLDEERRKVEDLQFRMEEEEIMKEDIEEKSGADSARLATVEKALREEKSKVKTLEEKVELLKPMYERVKSELKEAEDSATVHLDRVETLTHELNITRDKLLSLQETQREGQPSDVLVKERDAKILQLESQVVNLSQSLETSQSQTAQVSVMKAKLSEQDLLVCDLKEKLTNSQKRCEQFENEKTCVAVKIEELTRSLHVAESEVLALTQGSETDRRELKKMVKIVSDKDEAITKLEACLAAKSNEISSTHNTMQTTINEYKQKCKDHDASVNDIQSKLKMSEEKHEHLSNVKVRLENELMELMKNSGDSSSQYMNKIQQMTESLTEAENKIQRIEEDRRTYMLEVKKMTDSINEKDDVIKSLEASVDEKEKIIMSSSMQLCDVSDTVSKLEAKCTEQEAALEESRSKLILNERQKENLIVAKTKLEEDNFQLSKNADKITAQTAAKTAGLEMQHAEMRDKCKLLEVQNRNISSELDDVRNDSVEKKSEIKQLRELVDLKSQECTSLIVDLKSSRDKVDALRQEFIELKSSLSGTAVQLAETKKSNENLITEKRMLENQLDIAQKKCLGAENNCSDLKKSISVLNDQLTASRNDFAQIRREKVDLQNNFSNMNQSSGDATHQITHLETRLQEREVELESVQSIMATYVKKLASIYDNLGMECGNSVGMVSLLAADKGVPKQQMDDVVRGLESQVQEARTLLRERQALQNRLNEVDMAKQNGMTEPCIAQNDTQNVDFVNSVIVDLQRKNSELLTKLEVMESGSIFGGSNHSGSPVMRKGNAPRLFCDICEEFDVHDTEDCPRQTMSDCEVPARRPNTSPRGSISAQRPYCDICEMFGHTNNDCNDDQTF